MKKILIAEDNAMVSNVIRKTLTNRGFEVEQCLNGKDALQAILNSVESYSLIILDIEMPIMNGVELLKNLNEIPNFSVPVIILSGNESEDLMVELLNNGALDYISKPVSTNLLMSKVLKALGEQANVNLDSSNSTFDTNVINKSSVGIVIPCYNEENRLNSESFLKFVSKHSSYYICLVNDGSKDNTWKTILEIQSQCPEKIKTLNLDVNSGKAEAVRKGIIYLSENVIIDYVGFLDADLSTDFNQMEDMINLINQKQHLAIVGSRIQRIGADIIKQDDRAIISSIINKAITSLVGMPFKDTQCGAKLFDKKCIFYLFQNPFVSRWLFDVEIFIRFRKKLGKSEAEKKIYEFPLDRWTHMDGSKLSYKEAFRIIGELFKIGFAY